MRLIITILSLCLSAVVSAAQAQTVPNSLRDGSPEATLKINKNTWTVGLAGGLLEGTYMRLADEMAKVLDDGDNLRVLPIVSYGAAANLDDLLYLRGVDVAITQSDVFEYFRTERKTPNLENRVNYVLRLPVSELHILTRTDIKSIEDLRGKKVNFGPAGSATSLTATIVFQRLGIPVQQTMIDNPSALQKLKSGEVDALMRVVGKPVDFFTKIPPNSGLHLLPVPYSKKMDDFYTIGEFTAKDYPGLIAPGQTVDTIAVPAVLAVYNWPKGGDRYRRVERFVDKLFEKFERFQKPPFHPKWREVNLSATVPGWKRSVIAEAALTKASGSAAGNTASLDRDFQSFLAQSGGPAAVKNDADRDALFQKFLQWREKRASRGQ